MTERAFIGDIHGCLQALDGMLAALEQYRIKEMVFLGDYINKGPDSAGVLSRLIHLSHTSNTTLLRGNHEVALLESIEHKDLTQFLKMGGSATIRSYVGRDVGADVFADFVNAVPLEHLRAIQRMGIDYRVGGVIARHEPRRLRAFGRFAITAHRPTGQRPKLGFRSAKIDTGCGDDGGRLTAFLWPTRSYLQVDGAGNLVHQ